jgi:hypothetical protein
MIAKKNLARKALFAVTAVARCCVSLDPARMQLNRRRTTFRR